MTRLKHHGSLTLFILLGAACLYLVRSEHSSAEAGTAAARQPIALCAAATENDNFLLYRLWSDGLIDVRLVNPMKTQATDWPASNRAGISYQEGWKILQYGN